jgi:hypothetical protein
MTTINIKGLVIRVDVHDSHIQNKGDSRLLSLKNEAYSVIETINEALSAAGLNCQAQILCSGLDTSDIEEIKQDGEDDGHDEVAMMRDKD